TTPAVWPNAMPMPEIAPMRSSAAISGSIALAKTYRLSIPTAANTSAITIGAIAEPGVAVQSIAQPAAAMSALARIHGFLGPAASDIAPRRGAQIATARPAAACT